jgi:putative transposase
MPRVKHTFVLPPLYFITVVPVQVVADIDRSRCEPVGACYEAVNRSSVRLRAWPQVLAVGDGALGFWAALRDVSPSAKEQRCWVHKTANCLDALPKRLHAQAKTAIQAIYNAKTRTDAAEAAKAYAGTFKDFPKATAKITNELGTLLAFYDYPMEHWVHLRTTNPIESTFSTVRLRTRATRGAGSRKAALAMAYKLLDAAQARWHNMAAPELVPLVHAGATFIDGKLQERSTTETEDESTENGPVAA